MSISEISGVDFNSGISFNVRLFSNITLFNGATVAIPEPATDIIQSYLWGFTGQPTVTNGTQNWAPSNEYGVGLGTNNNEWFGSWENGDDAVAESGGVTNWCKTRKNALSVEVPQNIFGHQMGGASHSNGTNATYGIHLDSSPFLSASANQTTSNPHFSNRRWLYHETSISDPGSSTNGAAYSNPDDNTNMTMSTVCWKVTRTPLRKFAYNDDTTSKYIGFFYYAHGNDTSFLYGDDFTRKSFNLIPEFAQNLTLLGEEIGGTVNGGLGNASHIAYYTSNIEEYTIYRSPYISNPSLIPGPEDRYLLGVYASALPETTEPHSIPGEGIVASKHTIFLGGITLAEASTAIFPNKNSPWRSKILRIPSRDQAPELWDTDSGGTASDEIYFYFASPPHEPVDSSDYRADVAWDNVGCQEWVSPPQSLLDIYDGL